MSECVVRMEMPGSCLSCPFFNKVGCKASNRMFPDWMNVAARPRDCPIICQLPEGHGRLIDADKLFRDIPLKVCVPCPFGEEKECADCVIEKVMEMIDDAPTIVPPEAERSET